MTSKAVPWSSWLLTVAALLLACGTLLPAAAQDAAASATSSPSNVTTSTSSPSNATAGPMPAYANASLPAFQAVRACVPFTLLLQPNKNLTAGSNDSSTGEHQADARTHSGRQAAQEGRLPWGPLTTAVGCCRRAACTLKLCPDHSGKARACTQSQLALLYGASQTLCAQAACTYLPVTSPPPLQVASSTSLQTTR